MINHLLNRTLTVTRAATTDDAGGGRSTNYVDVGTVRARISQPSAEDREVGQRAEARITHHVYVRPDADVQRGDRLVDGAQSYYEVLAAVQPSAAVYTRCETELRQWEVTT